MDEISTPTLRRWLRDWQRGSRSKNEIERTELDAPQAHGKLISHLWRDRLGIETERRARPVVLLLILAKGIVAGRPDKKLAEDIIRIYEKRRH